MPETDFQPIETAQLDWKGDTPVARRFNDPYFSLGQGPAETRHVFLDGNGLIERLTRLPGNGHLAVGETGFGTGLNFLCTAEAFLRLAPQSAHLDYLAVDKHPLSLRDLATARESWPEFAELSRALQQHWPAPIPGFHRVTLAEGRIRLTLALGDAACMLRYCHTPRHAWFLDGFAPSRNPDMWEPVLFGELARLSRPGTTLATYTAAGTVRRGLGEAGFRMSRRAGFAGKRHMLTGVYGEATAAPEEQGPDRSGQTLVIGAGLAGTTTARALAERGFSVTVLDSEGVAAGASGTPAGVVYTTASDHFTTQNRFYQSSYLQALHWFARHGFPRDPGEGALEGVIQLPAHERGRRRTRRALESGLWPAGVLESAPGQADPDAVCFPGGGFIRPAAWCHYLLEHPGIRFHRATVLTLAYHADAPHHPWQVSSDQGTFTADAVVLANSGAAPTLAELSWLPIRPIRGQASCCPATDESLLWRRPVCHQGYLTPALNGLHTLGATFEQHHDSRDERDGDDRLNLEQLQRNLPEQWQALGGDSIRVTARRAGVRWQSRDFLPVVGPVPEDSGGAPGLYLNLAHGSRGITGTPLCAELLADRISGTTPPVDTEILDALLPQRFT